jgi:4-amino-4-deoxy-L-arabinose transferase-like glycosyltransferase
VFVLLTIAIILVAVLRSALATRLDGFTIDEPYHIVSGVAYVRTGDFRLNPEHPPLVKLWIGALMPASFKLMPFRAMDSKIAERDYHETTVFLQNDPAAVQRRSRAAMLAFHALLLAAFAFAARRVFGDLIALGAVAFLAIDPTVAAHMPVVMTDLPVALLSSIAVLCAITAFRTWRALDLAIAAVALGAALGAKHNAVIAAIVVTILGVAAVIGERNWRRAGHVFAVLAGGVLLLWAMYGFRYYETVPGRETFNAKLSTKIGALHTPLFRTVLNETASRHLLPRAYVWGLADVMRAGVEGRAYPVVFLGKTILGHTPALYFPAVVAAKLPIGLLLLAVVGLVLFWRRQQPGAGILLLAALFLITLMMSNSGYAGVRHALPLFPPLAILGGVAMTTTRRAFAIVALAAAMISALPVIRPWEYFNEAVGGPSGGYRAFVDEGLDLGQRVPELAAFYDAHLKNTNLPIYDQYGVLERDRQHRHLQLLGFMDAPPSDSDVIDGWFILNPGMLTADVPWADYSAFRAAKPYARLGNMVIYRGRFSLPWIRAQQTYFHAVFTMHSTPKPDLVAIEREVALATSITPRVYPMYVSLGNVRAKLGRREGAIDAFRNARRHAPAGDPLIAEIDRQIVRLSSEPPQQVPALMNPWAE